MVAPRSWPRGAAEDAVLALDFDGTLAPIVDNPAEARMPEDTAEVLTRLAAVLGTVAIISGRGVAYLARWAAVPGAQLVGLYGLERYVDGEIVRDPRVLPYEEALATAKARAAALTTGHPGSEVEDKGAAIAIHWRRAEDHTAAATELPAALRELSAELGLATTDGKMVIELHPPIDVDKGDALRSVLGDAAGDVAFAGDDLGDLPAFRAVAAAGGLGILVDHGTETAAELREAADAIVDGPAGLVDWLDEVLATLSGA